MSHQSPFSCPRMISANIEELLWIILFELTSSMKFLQSPYLIQHTHLHHDSRSSRSYSFNQSPEPSSDVLNDTTIPHDGNSDYPTLCPSLTSTPYLHHPYIREITPQAFLAWDDVAATAHYSPQSRCFLPLHHQSPLQPITRRSQAEPSTNRPFDYISSTLSPLFDPNDPLVINNARLSPLPALPCRNTQVSSTFPTPTENSNSSHRSQLSSLHSNPNLDSPIPPRHPLTKHAYLSHLQSTLARRSKVLKFPSYTHNSSTLVHLLRIYQTLRIISLHINSNTYISLRDVYYANPLLYSHSQSISNETISTLQSLLKCTRNDLHIIAADRGLCFGPLQIEMNLIQTASPQSDHNLLQTTHHKLSQFQSFNIPPHPTFSNGQTRYCGTIDFSQQPRALFSFSNHYVSSFLPFDSAIDAVCGNEGGFSELTELHRDHSNQSPFHHTTPPLHQSSQTMTHYRLSYQSQQQQPQHTTLPPILVVEKETVFHRLVQTIQHFHTVTANDPPGHQVNNTLSNAIIMTSKGYPNITSRLFISNLYPRHINLQSDQARRDISPHHIMPQFQSPSPNQPLITHGSSPSSAPLAPCQLIMVDGDPYGLDIAMKYIIGTPSLCLDCPFPLPLLKYIGVRVSVVHIVTKLHQFLHQNPTSLQKGIQLQHHQVEDELNETQMSFVHQPLHSFLSPTVSKLIEQETNVMVARLSKISTPNANSNSRLKLPPRITSTLQYFISTQFLKLTGIIVLVYSLLMRNPVHFPPSWLCAQDHETTPLPPFIDLGPTLCDRMQPNDLKMVAQLIQHPYFTSLRPDSKPTHPTHHNTKPKHSVDVNSLPTHDLPLPSASAAPLTTSTANQTHLATTFDDTRDSLLFEALFMLTFEKKCESEVLTTIFDQGMYHYVEYFMNRD